MNTIIRYLTVYGQKSLKEEPFNEVDSLILCQLSYLNYGDFVGGLNEDGPGLKAEDILKIQDREILYEGYWYKKDNHKLLEEFANSKRFGRTRLNYYENIINEEKDAQFSALTYILPDKSVYIAYRGTDATLVGWKEDMMLAYSKPLRSQELAKSYMERVSAKFLGPFRTGGHSKGGNLAVYASMYVSQDIRSRISDVFDHDGPGFRPEILEKGNFSDLKDSVHKYIPKSSIVGIILEDQLPYEVVESFSIGALQHNAYSWKCKGTSLVRAKNIPNKMEFSEKTLNEWIYSLAEEEVDTFIDTLYEVFTANDAKSLYDLIQKPGETISSGLEVYKDLPIKTKDALQIIFKRLVGIINENAFSQIILQTKKVRDKIEAKPEAKSQAKPEAKRKAKSEAKQEAKPEAKSEAKRKAKRKAKPEAKRKAKPEAKRKQN